MIDYIEIVNVKEISTGKYDLLKSIDQNDTLDEWVGFGNKVKIVNRLYDIFKCENTFGSFFNPIEKTEPLEIKFGITIGKTKYDYYFSMFENDILAEFIKIDNKPTLYRTKDNISLCPSCYFSKDSSYDNFKLFSGSGILPNPSLLRFSDPGKEIENYLSKIMFFYDYFSCSSFVSEYKRLQKIFGIDDLFSEVSVYLNRFFGITKLDNKGYVWYDDKKLPLEVEGSGVVFFCNMFPYLYISKIKGYTLFASDFDNYFHPIVASEIYHWYYDKDNNNGQLITRFKHINKSDGSIFTGRRNC